MLPLANGSSSALVPHFRFDAISYIPVPPSFSIPLSASMQNKTLTMEIRTVNQTHFSFAAGSAKSREPLTIFAYAPGDIVSWGFTGTLLGVYATSNGGNGTTEAYVSNWKYEGWGQIRDNFAGPLVQ